MTDLKEDMPHLDLLNFDNPAYDGSKYILTSPRSLQACANIGIKPIQLLPVDFDTFKKENPTASFDRVKRMFDEVEASRRDNLRRARQERDRLIDSRATTKTLFSKESRAAPLAPVNDLRNGIQGRALLENTKAGSEDESKSVQAKAALQRPSRFQHSRAAAVPKTRNIERVGSSCSTLDRPHSSSAVSIQRMKSALNYSALERPGSRQSKLHEKIQQMDADYARPRHQTRSRDSLSLSEFRRRSSCDADSQSRRVHTLEQNRKELKLLEQKFQRDMDEKQSLAEREKSLLEKDEKHRRLLQKEQKKLAEKLATQRAVMNEKRQKLAKNMRLQEEYMLRYHQDLATHCNDNLRRAEQERLRKEMLDIERRKVENHLREAEVSQRKYQLKVDMREKNEDLVKSLQDRDSRVARNQMRIHKDKYSSMHTSQVERMRKLRQSAERRKILDEEIKAYQEELQSYQDTLLSRAEIRVRQKLTEEQRRIHEERMMREEVRKSNFQQLKSLEDEWKEDAEAILRFKEEKSKKLQSEMQARVQESRALALAAEQLREDIRRAYNLDSFDKKVHQANLVNQLGLGK